MDSYACCSVRSRAPPKLLAELMAIYLGVVTFALHVQPVAAEEPGVQIGATRFVVPSAEHGSTDTQLVILTVGTNVFANDVVKTGAVGRTGLEFLDKTRFEVGPNSSAKLDKFV